VKRGVARPVTDRAPVAKPGFPSRALVTGGLGFLGSNLTRALAEGGTEVTVLDAVVEGSGANRFNLEDLSDRVEFIEADLGDYPHLADAVRGMDAIYDLVAQTGHMASMHNPTADLYANVGVRIPLLDACRKENPEARLVFTSTRQVYGRPESLPVDEGHPLAPPDVNAINKIAAEHYYALYGQRYGLRACVLRLTNCFGPRMRVTDARQSVVGAWIRAALDGEPITVWGDGSQIRDLNYVDDVVDAMIRASARVEAVGRILNLGSSPVTLRELAEAIVEVSGSGSVEIAPFPEGRRAIDIGSYHADFREATRLLGWEPRVSLHDGLRRTLDFYRLHRDSYWSG
jgi:UDP-glucose 4-epimerase